MAPQPDFIISFYSTSTMHDAQGRTFNDLLRFNNQELEYNHDYIQILFPLPESSPINPGAPVITPEVRQAFIKHPALRERLVLALERMLQFYGFGLNPSYSRLELATMTTAPDHGPGETAARGDRIDDPSALIGRGANFKRRATASWLKRGDHNHLRLTRIIRCLRVLGLEVLARALFEQLLESDEERVVSQRSRMFWARAAERDLWLAPSEDNDGKGVTWLREELERGGSASDETMEGDAGGQDEEGMVK
ncbi:hypothetical protein LTR09_000358 [Extremus antarcticus]|uniref:Opioid growth factor receptor (OGFr) conserved domain-containing protein n=1 Tax=Extremus antarcticus TaxID=702011 RepID=A0AAJ0GJN8_9PEZI|nr:hypothetical protein LTR09_000358 [Extremus antarcticus]